MLTFCPAPLERYVFCIQRGGALCISGTATLINTAIYQNEASVCSAFEPV